MDLSLTGAGMKKREDFEQRAAEALVKANRTSDPKEMARQRAVAYALIEKAAKRRKSLNNRDN
jgi:hypothetical protein